MHEYDACFIACVHAFACYLHVFLLRLALLKKHEQLHVHVSDLFARCMMNMMHVLLHVCKCACLCMLFACLLSKSGFMKEA